MFLEERYDKILELLSEHGRVSVKDLAQTFDVTEDCIRKYLKELEGMDKLKRVYGGAIPLVTHSHAQIQDVWERKKTNLDVKEIIAQKAFSLIQEGDTLFLDPSTTNLEIAKLIASSTLKLTVITNMADIILVLANHPTIQLLSIGGMFNHHLGGVIGSEANLQIQKYHYDKAFIGICGINVARNCIYTTDLEDGYTKKCIMDNASEVFLVMENEKFFYEEFYKYSTLDRITGIITEEMPDSPIALLLKEKAIKLI